MKNMSKPKNLDFVVSLVQGKVSLSNMSDLKSLDLAVSQAQGSTSYKHVRRIGLRLGS
jgi:hypothetical protein